MNPEYVYCLKNDEMPNICKCGGTADSPYNRCEQLSNTSLPVKCEVAYFVEVNNWIKAEKYIHNKLNELGIKRFKGREWFKCKPDDIKSVFDECKKLFGFDKDGGKDGVIEKDNMTDGVKDNISDKIKNKSYYCEICDYTIYERTAYIHHLKSKKHESCSKYNLLKKENIEQKNKLVVYEKEKIKDKSYYCELCDYITFERGNYSRHKKQIKHIEKIKSVNNIDLIKKENIEQKIKLEIYEKEIFSLKNELLKKELEILKLNNNNIFKK